MLAELLDQLGFQVYMDNATSVLHVRGPATRWTCPAVSWHKPCREAGTNNRV